MRLQSTDRPSANLFSKLLLLKENNSMGPLRLSTGEDGQYLQSLSREIVSDETPRNSLMFTTGLGLTSEKMPVRLPTVIVPTMQVMERMRDIGLPVPKYLVYQATDFIAQTNLIEMDVARKTSELMEQYLQRYIETFHPLVKDKIEFRFGAKATAPQEHIEALIAELKDRIFAHPIIKTCMDKLGEYRQNNGKGAGTEYPYAAANILFNGAQTERYPFADSLDDDTQAILPVGGKREEPFFHMTRVFNNSSPKVIPLLQRAGEMPTYYPYKGGDILSAEKCHSDAVQALSGPIKYDFDVLKSDGATLEALQDIYSSIS